MASVSRTIPAALSLLLGAAPLCGCGSEPSEEPVGEAIAASDIDDDALDIDAHGSFSCDFGLPPDLPLELVPPQIERDRMYMAERPGMQTKQLPLGFDLATGAIYSGGRYLFDTFKHAKDYSEWVHNGFFLDGVEFLDRPIFLAPECHAWRVVGARAFAPIEAQLVLRTERFHLPPGVTHHALRQAFRAARKEAHSRDLSAVWLLENADEELAQLVYFADRVGPNDPTTPDFASLGALAGAPPLGDTAIPASWTRTFDRTQWVLTVWFPFAKGDHGAPSLWPYSPPFPQPFCGDGLCEPSRGESGASCASDCQIGCGNGKCKGAEDTVTCPSDCRL